MARKSLAALIIFLAALCLTQPQSARADGDVCCTACGADNSTFLLDSGNAYKMPGAFYRLCRVQDRPDLEKRLRGGVYADLNQVLRKSSRCLAKANFDKIVAASIEKNCKVHPGSAEDDDGLAQNRTVSQERQSEVAAASGKAVKPAQGALQNAELAFNGGGTKADGITGRSKPGEVIKAAAILGAVGQQLEGGRIVDSLRVGNETILQTPTNLYRVKLGEVIRYDRTVEPGEPPFHDVGFNVTNEADGEAALDLVRAPEGSLNAARSVSGTEARGLFTRWFGRQAGEAMLPAEAEAGAAAEGASLMEVGTNLAEASVPADETPLGWTLLGVGVGLIAIGGIVYWFNRKK